MTLASCAAQPDRCSSGYHYTAQHPALCQCTEQPDPQTLKLAGINAANDAAPDDVKDRIDAAIRRWAEKGVEFSANTIREEFAGITGAVVGGRFNAAARAGLIVDTGKRVASTLGSTHGHEVRVWCGAQAARWSA